MDCSIGNTVSGVHFLDMFVGWTIGSISKGTVCFVKNGTWMILRREC